MSVMDPTVTDDGRPSTRAALERALAQLSISELDAGAVALARRLAHDVDEARLVHADVREALDQLPPGVGVTARRALERLAVRVESTAVLASLAPRLLDCLTALGLTPAARAAIQRGRSAGEHDPAGPAGNPADEVRRRREQRGAGPR